MIAYRDLETRFREMALLDEAASVLHWDSAVVMPPAAAGRRGEQLAALRVVGHERLTDPGVTKLLDRAEASLETDPGSLNPWQRANLREMRRLQRRAVSVPADLVSRMSMATARCESVWREARAEANFQLVAADLTNVVALAREYAGFLANSLNVEPYDALLDGFEPGLKASDFEPVFDDYIAFLRTNLPAILERQRSLGPAVQPRGPFPRAAQRALTDALIKTVGFPLGTAGRIDESAHPFSTGYPDDSRITIGIDEASPLFCLMAAMHECGHALYEMGLPEDWQRQPVGSARGMATHESQSLIVEMQACRSPEYATWVSASMVEFLGDDPAFQPANLLKLLTHVEPDFIRVDADEVTYPAHIVLRTRLERALLSGDLPAPDLPAAWKAGMEEVLGIVPPNDRLGCLQDIHWYDGAFGYFPTYSLGAMAAAQLMEAARAAAPDIMTRIGSGDFGGLVGWLRGAVHGVGSRLSSEDILTAATGHPLDPAAFKRHIRRRYLGDGSLS